MPPYNGDEERAVWGSGDSLVHAWGPPCPVLKVKEKTTATKRKQNAGARRGSSTRWRSGGAKVLVERKGDMNKDLDGKPCM